MESPRQHPPAEPVHDRGRRTRRQSLLLFGVLVVLLHAWLLGGPEWKALGRSATPQAGVPMAARTIEQDSASERPEPPGVAPAPAPVVPPPRPRPRPRRPREPTVASVPSSVAAEAPEAAASEPVPASAPLESAPLAVADADPTAPEPAPVPAPAPASAPAPAASAPSLAASAPAPAASATFLAVGEAPPPTYRTRLPPSVTLRYEVRRGFLRGSGEIRWQHVGDDYGLRLEARIAGITLLAQTSQGVVDSAGLAPVRFLDQRARRAAQAANFRRDSDIVTFSGPATVWPLLRGSQDQLSWMIQLAGIVAAEPERASAGGRISMVIVGARGDASVRTLRFVGEENASTVSGPVPALKFMVDARGPYDSSYEIWLDPARDFLPVHATRRNSAGDSDFDLLLEGIEPIS